MLIARALLVTLLTALSVLAQSNPVSAFPAGTPEQATPTFRSETNLVLVRFQMIPKKGGSNDLRPEDIELREDGVVQKITVFQGGQLYAQSIPVEINLLFDDVSGIGPFRGRVRPLWMDSWKLDIGAIDDRGIASVAVWALGQNLVRLTPPTRDPSMLYRAMDSLWNVWFPPYASEPRLLATIAALGGMANQGRTNVVRTITVLTTGCNVEQDDKAAKAVEGIGAAIFPLVVRNVEAQVPDFYSRSPSMGVTGCDDKGVLASVAKKSGGQAISITPVEAVRGGFEQVIQSLRDQIEYGYAAGFYAPSSGQRKAHRIQVVLKNSSRGKLSGNARTLVH